MKRKKKRAHFSAIIIVGVTVVISSFFLTEHCSSPPTSEADYRALIEFGGKELSAIEAERLALHFQIQNQGRETWTSKGKYPFFFSYHLMDRDGNTIQHDNPRFPFPHKMKPGQTTEMRIVLRVPLQKGNYILEFDLLREGLLWFKEDGSKTIKIPLWVRERRWPDEEYPLTINPSKFTRLQSSEPELNTIYKLIRLTLEKNQTGFKGRTGIIHGFSAGTDYPQIWLRDSATIIPASRYFYPSSYLTSWLEEHLVFQKDSGSLEDWIDSKGESDKNSTETDQESSAVQAAYQIYQTLGAEWLKKAIQNKRIIDRLEKALLYVRSHRWDENHGLAKGAHTADWGDIDMQDSGPEAVNVDKKTHWTADIYDQSMFFQSCLNLSEMFGALGEKGRQDFWLKTAHKVRTNTDKWLWQEDRGFYRVHVHLDSLRHDFDEGMIFALGGNTQAILSNLSDELKTTRIIASALRRQNFFHISTISGTLLPPYPKGFFKHPLLDDPYEYQNGAQWDWFGGRFVYAMFSNGFSRLAKKKMVEIFQKNIFNRGFFEWDTREGHAAGSDHYCGSAGSLSRALFEGYFGIKLTKDTLEIQPRLHQDEATVHIYVPAMDISVAYKYSYSRQEEKLTLFYNSDFPRAGRIKILSPWHPVSPSDLSVKKDGIEHPFDVENIRNDTYIVLETDFANHMVQAEKKD